LESIKYKFYYAGYVVFLGIIAAVLLWLLSKIQIVVVLLIGSIFLAYLLFPMVNFFEKPIELIIPSSVRILKRNVKTGLKEKKIMLRKTGFKRPAAIVLVYLFWFLFIVVGISIFIPNVAYESKVFINNLPALGEKFDKGFDAFIASIEPKLPEGARGFIPQLIQKITDEMEKYTYQTAAYVFSLVQKLFSALFAVIIIPIFTFYILLDVEKFKSAFERILPNEKRDEIMGLMRKIDKVIGIYIRGQIVVGIFIAIAVTVALFICDVEYAFLIGLISGAVNFIPYLGVIICIVPSVLLALIGKGIMQAIVVAALLLFIQQLEGQIISPAVMGEALGLPPLIIIMALIIGGQSLGLLGMLIAVPLSAIIKVTYNYYNPEVKTS